MYLLKKILTFDKVVVVGVPMVGKTIITNKVFTDRDIIHTDDFIKTVSWEKTPEKIIALVKDKSRFVIEGIQGIRILRKGYRLKTFKADAILFIKPKFDCLPKHKGIRKGLKKMWNDYLLESSKENIPIFEVIEDELLL